MIEKVLIGPLTFSLEGGGPVRQQGIDSLHLRVNAGKRVDNNTSQIMLLSVTTSTATKTRSYPIKQYIKL